MSIPERRYGRIAYQPAAKPIRWSMKSTAGNISSSWPADITSWEPRPEITSSLTQSRNAKESPSYREEHQHRLHVCFGSSANIRERIRDVRFTPMAGMLSGGIDVC